jgi:hypothetical protein
MPVGLISKSRLNGTVKMKRLKMAASLGEPWMIGAALILLVMAAAGLATPAYAAPDTIGLVSLSLQGVGNGAVIAGNCSGLACKSGDTCACLLATYSLVGNQGFGKGSLSLQLNVDTSITTLPISDLNESCNPAAGNGTIKNSSGKTQLSLVVSGLECPTVGIADVFNGTYVIAGGSGGKYSATTGGTGTINGSQVPASSRGTGAAQVLIAGSVQTTGPPVPTPKPTATVPATPVPTPKPTATVPATPVPTPKPTATVPATPVPTSKPTSVPSGTPTSTPAPAASCTPTYTGTPQGNDTGFCTTLSGSGLCQTGVQLQAPITVPASSTTPGCYQVAFVETDNPGVQYAGMPAGWNTVFARGQATEADIIIHKNGPNEPASNVWTTAETKNEVYELNISTICGTSGFAGGIQADSAHDATSMVINAPPLSLAGVNNLTLAFSIMPWNNIVTMSSAGSPVTLTGFYTSVPSLGGYWYTGTPQSLNVTVGTSGGPAFSGDGTTWQASFAPGAACH